MAFGFLVERFDLFLQIAGQTLAKKALSPTGQLVGNVAGLILIVLGATTIVLSIWRFRRTAIAIDSPDTVPGPGDRIDFLLAGLLTMLGRRCLFISPIPCQPALSEPSRPTFAGDLSHPAVAAASLEGAAARPSAVLRGSAHLRQTSHALLHHTSHGPPSPASQRPILQLHRGSGITSKFVSRNRGLLLLATTSRSEEAIRTDSKPFRLRNDFRASATKGKQNAERRIVLNVRTQTACETRHSSVRGVRALCFAPPTCRRSTRGTCQRLLSRWLSPGPGFPRRRVTGVLPLRQPPVKHAPCGPVLVPVDLGPRPPGHGLQIRARVPHSRLVFRCASRTRPL